MQKNRSSPWWRPPIVGPLFYYEAIRGARRGRIVGLRCAYGLSVLLIFYLFYASWMKAQGAAVTSLNREQMSRFAEEFFNWFLAAQVGAVLLLTPAYTAGAIAEEKQRRSLGELLTTPLTSREIILGKLAARVAQMVLLLLTAIPILFLTLYFGGLDLVLVAIGFAGTAILLVSVASLGIACSVVADRPLHAILTTYGLLFVSVIAPFLIALLSPHLAAPLFILHPVTGSDVAAAKADEAPKYTPPVIKPEDVKQGTVKEFAFKESKVFPGTVRDVTLFIPAQYDAQKPACVYVKTDGYNPREKALLETMIATKEIPVTVGVFVKPGTLPAPMKGTADRRNRCFEYDAVNDNNVRFFDEELLPFIAKEYQLNLSTEGNDRCISGGSSGGIAAFTAAWNRPQAFSRVYAASGSWVAFRGGHEFPTLVRKFEARPIRAYLTTATHDMENAAGDWFLLDQEMDKALKFSGYDYQFRIIEGRHVQGYAENWQEAMAFLWKDWPKPVKAGPSAPRAQDILIPGEDWKLVGEGFKSTRGPACNAQGEVFFADTTNNKIHRIGLDDKVSVFVDDAGQAHSVTVGADGTLFSISEKSGKLMHYDAEGKGTIVLDGILGHSILARPDGSLYVTTNGDGPNGPGSVWLVKDGQKKQVDTGIKFATGMAYRPDQWLLSVAEGHSKWVYSYQIAADGTLTNKERFFHLHVADWDDDAGTESACYSIEGRQFLATRSGVQISADDGPTQVILPVPDHARVIGVALGGKDKDTLYALCGNKIWKRKVKHHAMGAWAPWTKVAPHPL